MKIIGCDFRSSRQQAAVFDAETGEVTGTEVDPWRRGGGAVLWRAGGAGADRDRGVRKRIEAAGAQLRYLPPYSPDLNPIEKA